MRILVTGGAGFIGSHLCKFLLEKNHKVICLDNFYTGQRRNIEPFFNNPNFQFANIDITCPFFFEVDQIYNLACPASPIHYQRNPVETVRINIIGILHCLELSEKLGKIKVLQASTSEIYGDPKMHPQKETYWGNVNPIGRRSCYDEGKRCAETICFDYYREKNIPIKVVRIFNTYGPNMAMDDGRVVSNFIVQALKGEDLTIYGDGRQTRSFCYVSDMVAGLYSMMEYNGWPGPVNLGNPTELEIKEIAEKIIEITRSRSKIIFHPLPEDDPKKRKPDISLAREKLGWELKIPLEEGLKKTIEYFKKIV